MTWLRLFAHGDANYWTAYFPATFLLGYGIAAAFPMIAVACVRGMGRNDLSLATATNRTFLQLGNAIGIAAVVAVLGTARGAGAIGEFRLAWMLLASLALCCALAITVTGSPEAKGGFMIQD
jgi:hypothetical protein